ncbi:DgyrCDS8415 [Dimorphilus gyrociliatus]|uniref:DgyrCDS8415 n=1 Tax=Dimorphilus gyrociliatus TaxID=2664684 RepID=A0A7I8VU60_9ANNE|nr:DgyrCDS8415 [Dimorphilus gyrociliatus]
MNSLTVSQPKVNIRGLLCNQIFNPTKFVAVVESDQEIKVVDDNCVLIKGQRLMIHYRHTKENGVFMEEEPNGTVHVYENERNRYSAINRSKLQFVNEFGNCVLRVSRKSRRYICLDLRKRINSVWPSSIAEYFKTFRAVSVQYQDVEGVLHVTPEVTPEWTKVLNEIEVEDNFYKRTKSLRTISPSYTSSPDSDWSDVILQLNSTEILPTVDELKRSVESYRNQSKTCGTKKSLDSDTTHDYDQTIKMTVIERTRKTFKAVMETCIQESDKAILQKQVIQDLNENPDVIMTELERLKRENVVKFEICTLLNFYINASVTVSDSCHPVITELCEWVIFRVVKKSLGCFEAIDCLSELIANEGASVLKKYCPKAVKKLLAFLEQQKSTSFNSKAWNQIIDCFDYNCSEELPFASNLDGKSETFGSQRKRRSKEHKSSEKQLGEKNEIEIVKAEPMNNNKKNEIYFENQIPKRITHSGRMSVASRIEKSAEVLNIQRGSNSKHESDDETKDYWKPNHRKRACGICYSREHKTIDCEDRKAFLAS